MPGMAFSRFSWSIIGVILASAQFQSHVQAAPSVNVALKTSFSTSPYLLELLETAADENATSYFPLLDRIADGYFQEVGTHKDLYESFLKLLENDGHISDLAALSSYKLALSLHSAAPRIEAHYQYYHSAVEPRLKEEEDTSCPNWVMLGNAQYCSPALDHAHGDIKINSQYDDLPFDRVMGNLSAPASVLYADITSSTFGAFHKTLIKTAREGKTSYKIRHRKPIGFCSQPLLISGYGVELALKRTDYIVIDDRDKESKTAGKEASNVVSLDEDEVSDLKPLSTSELVFLGLKASSFVMQNEDPFQTLAKLTQDFPKYSAIVAAHNTSTDFADEHAHNRGLVVPAGENVLWINGLQVAERQIDAFSLMNLMRKERQLIRGVQDLGFSGPEAVALLSHPAITKARGDDEPNRYDWTDREEGGNVIIWLNDIEKDSRYEGWPTHLGALLQRTYPGQLPAIRLDIFNLVVPVDLSSAADVHIIVQQLRGFVQRKLPLRFGIVPITPTEAAADHAKIVYYLKDKYGLATALKYLEDSLNADKLGTAQKSLFESAIEGKAPRRDKIPSHWEGLKTLDTVIDNLKACQNWASRLSVTGPILPLFIDGVVIPRSGNWLQSMSQRVTADLSMVQTAIFEERLDSNGWIPDFFLISAIGRRNKLIIPEDDISLKILDMNKLERDHEKTVSNLPRTAADKNLPKSEWAQIIIVADLSTVEGQDLLFNANQIKETYAGIELLVVNNALSVESLAELLADDQRSKSEKKLFDINPEETQQYFQQTKALVSAFGLRSGERGVLINGRVVGPIPDASQFTIKDFEQLLSYERNNRIYPACAAVEELGLSDKITSPTVAAKISSVIAVSTTPNGQENIYEQTHTVRVSTFNAWHSAHTAIEVGNPQNATLFITVSLDPASETAQRWVPILKVLSEMQGVYLRIFLNPRDLLLELPVKRFYRYVLSSEPAFNSDGNQQTQGAKFTGVPQDALLNLGMDVPPPWLVAPKDSINDLDNIKLSSVKTDVDALYELEHILIEGHSREMPGGAAPRGAQLVLGTDRDPHFADTIIMSNLGYFQFKANPGYYHIELQTGRSSQIFKIDSLGAAGWEEIPSDDSLDLTLMSFQGVTLYPRLSRKQGQEDEDVLEAKTDSMESVSQGLKYAKKFLGLSKKATSTAQADINIFSVASGHLYERMLNIMMVSVMKHTKHTVKFWFIEQFLSPSFKDFIPHLAAEYGFDYEMVTYKWPHWLRAQTEKQREIWGYKILFLDVLFPLSLDKVIFVDADQIVRTDMIELVTHDLQGAPYGFTPMCDSRTEMEGFRFWKQGYWKNFLKGLPYHISALYVVDLKKFRQIAAGDRLRQQYHQLSADPGSLSNLDQDLPNHMQSILPIHSLPQEWLWCETWCSDESLKEAKTIDLCNNPQTKEPKLDRARRQVPEWTVYDQEIAAVDAERRGLKKDNVEKPVAASTAAKDSKSRSHEESNEEKHMVDEL